MTTAHTLKPTVLVVDDEKDVLNVVARFLRLAGYNVIEAGSAHEAIAICEGVGSEIDLVLSDYSMPGMNGLELAVSLHKNRPNLPIMFMSGSQEAEEHLAARGTACFSKPLVFADLIATIQRTLAR